MASLVSVSFFTPPFSRVLLEENDPKKAALSRLSSQATGRRATMHLPVCGSTNGMCPINQSYNHYLTSPSKHFAETVSFHLETHMIMTGYWIGPDIDDGWGLIDAFVDRGI